MNHEKKCNLHRQSMLYNCSTCRSLCIEQNNPLIISKNKCSWLFLYSRRRHFFIVSFRAFERRKMSYASYKVKQQSVAVQSRQLRSSPAWCLNHGLPPTYANCTCFLTIMCFCVIIYKMAHIHVHEQIRDPSTKYFNVQ